METPIAIQIFKSTVGNPVTRRILEKMCVTCEKDGNNRLEVALELYVGVREKGCRKCKLAEKALASVLKVGGERFGVSENELKERIKDPYWRKGLVNVVKGIAKFGVKRPFVPAAPFLVVWDLTYACNLRCKHCYANAGKPLEDELTTKEAKKTVKILADAGVPILAFSGGEPLIRKDFFEIARCAADYGMYTAIATNGTLITKATAKKMRSVDLKFVQASLDGATAETHDAFRATPGAFQRTIQGIKNCVEEGLFVNVATTATRLNYSEIPKIIDLCEKLRVNWFMAYNFVPTGRGRSILKNDLSPEMREDLLRTLWKKLNESEVNVLSTAPQFARVALDAQIGRDDKIVPTHFCNPQLSGRLCDLAEFIGGCGAGRFYCSIKPNGDIQPCVFFPLKVGNILEDDFEALWHNNQVFLDLRDKNKLRENCGKCKYRYQCGGCRARASAYFNDYLAPDPGCVNNKEAYKRLWNENERNLSAAVAS